MAKKKRRYKSNSEDRDIVKDMIGYGSATPEEIARYLKISMNDLYRCYWHELDTAAIVKNHKVAEALFHLAVKEKNPQVLIQWAKCRLGWKEADAKKPGNRTTLIKEITEDMDIHQKAKTFKEMIDDG